MRISEILTTAAQRLSAAGREAPRRDARRLLSGVSGLSAQRLVAHGEDVVSEDVSAAFDTVVERHLAGEPMSRIFGTRDFWTGEYMISPAVLDPRPETETLVRAALEIFGTSPPERLIDLGTGSGCVLISLLGEWPMAEGVGVDLSPAALNVARHNAGRLHVTERATFVPADMTEAGLSAEVGKAALVVSNPPYVAREDMAGLPQEVQNYDPPMALDGGHAGMEVITRMLPGVRNMLKPEGVFLMECGAGQAEEVQSAGKKAGLVFRRTVEDFSGHLRVLVFSRHREKKD